MNERPVEGGTCLGQLQVLVKAPSDGVGQLFK